ncbi:MAG: hypothetical protein O3C40_05530 [Planctomycetota bacterium]|nr:hypothetical protein [Planctomycetota bacterium]
MDNLLSTMRMDRSLYRVRSLDEEGDDREYWHSQTPEQRLLAAELMRQIVYGYDPATERLQRVFRVVSLEKI